jgi:ATP synthase F1 complex assembly factor 1
MIWNKFHDEKQFNVSKTLSGSLYGSLIQKAQHSPIFVFPVPRDNGHMMMVSQYQDKSILFAYLEDFKKDQTNSQPYFIVTFFDELIKQKGLAFVRGDIVTGFSKQEAKILLNQFVAHHLSDELFDKVNKFNH